MGSDSSHEFGEIMAGIIYILIFALSIGIGIMAVRNTVKVTKEYNVDQYLILNAILSSIHEIYYLNGSYYIPETFIKKCGKGYENFENCLHISIPNNYHVKIYHITDTGGESTLLNIPGGKEYKIIYRTPLLIEYNGLKNFGWLEIGVGK